MCVHETHLVPFMGFQRNASAQICWSATVLWQMSRRPMVCGDGRVVGITTTLGRWPEVSAHHDVHVDHGKDVGDERSGEDSDRPWGVSSFFYE